MSRNAICSLWSPSFPSLCQRTHQRPFPTYNTSPQAWNNWFGAQYIGIEADRTYHLSKESIRDQTCCANQVLNIPDVALSSILRQHKRDFLHPVNSERYLKGGFRILPRMDKYQKSFTFWRQLSNLNYMWAA